MADLLFYHCLLSPLPHTTIPCLLLSSTVHYITYFYTQLLHDYILSHNSPTLQTHTHSYLLSCAYLRFWFGFGQGMFAVFLVLGSQYKKGAARLIIVCEMCLYGKQGKKNEAEVGMRRLQDFIILTEPPDGICGVSLFCGWQGGSWSHCVAWDQRRWNTHSSIHHPFTYSPSSWYPYCSIRQSTQTMICSAGGWIFLTLQGLKTFLSDMKNPFVNVGWERKLRVS